MLKCQMDDRPYRLVVSVIRGTNAGRALTLMANGIQYSAETEKEALALYDQYMDAAAAILDHVSQGICMGMVSILNTNTGKVLLTGTMMGTNGETTLGRHTA